MKQEAINVDGKVIESLPNAMFRVKIPTSEELLLCHISGKIRINSINIRVGDSVKLELSPYDLTRGRIVYLYKEGFEINERKTRDKKVKNRNKQNKPKRGGKREIEL